VVQSSYTIFNRFT